MIRVENLVKKYGDFTAVNELNFNIEEGEIFGFVGSNGAGKSTTMKVAAGLLKPTAGTVYVGGYDVRTQRNEAKSLIGYMPDFFGVYDDLKVMEYMNFYCGIHKIHPKDRDKVIMPLIELVNLEDKVDFYVDDLSRGMKQRLCLARALIHNPKLLILDEPASGLDPRARVEFREIVKTLSDLGKTVLISSHILLELAEICTTIGIIEKGQMVVKGSVSEIRQQLAHLSKIKLRTAGELDLAVPHLREHPEVSDITIANGYLEFSFGGEDRAKYLLLKQLIEKDIEICHFEEAAGSLESIFMHLTEEEEVAV